jgi:RNA polymerase sigma-70 factor (ECF subfamily)
MKPWGRVDRSKHRVRATPTDEPDLLARCRAGETDAYRILVERYREHACRLAYRFLRSEADAEEVAQDAFVRAWRALPEFRGDAAFSTWLYRIVVRRAMDRAATLRLRRERETSLEDVEGVGGGGGVAAEPSPDAESGGRDTRRIESMMEVLSEAQRAVVTLFYFEDHSVEDVARLLSLPTGTVKTHLSRARAVLRREWGRRERLRRSNEL